MLKYLKVILICGFRILFDYFAWMIRYSRHPEKYPIELRYKRVRNLIRFVFKAFGATYYLNNEELFQKRDKASLIISNHLSNSDPLVLIATSEKPISFIAKIEAKKFPLIGRCIRALDGIFLDRNDIKQEVRAVIEASKRIKENNISYCIFPEGTRNKDPFSPLGEFKAGAFKIATKANCDVISVGLFGTFRILDKHYKGKKFPIQINYINEYSPDYINEIKTTDFSIKIREEISQVVTSLIEKDKELYISKNKKR